MQIGKHHAVDSDEVLAYMSTLPVEVGKQVAISGGTCSEKPKDLGLSTLKDLLGVVEHHSKSTLPMLRTTCRLICECLDESFDEVTIEQAAELKEDFRKYLQTRKYAENSVRSYVNYLRILLDIAKKYGWAKSRVVSQGWSCVLRDVSTQCRRLTTEMSQIRKEPKDVTIEDVEQWVERRVQNGYSYMSAIAAKRCFWRLLHSHGCTNQPIRLQPPKYGVPLLHFPASLRSEVLELLRWKTAEFSVNRPKNGRHREVSSRVLRLVIQEIYGFAVNVQKRKRIVALSKLIQMPTVAAYVEWLINERKAKGYCLRNALGVLSSALHQHPAYSTSELTWFKPLLESIPSEHQSELRARKALKYVGYDVLAAIPSKIHAGRAVASKKGLTTLSRLVMEELLMTWLVVLPWRQRNIRECRVGGTRPNVFRAKVPPFSEINKPEWVNREERTNPSAEFWQFRFGVDETKTKIEVHALLPRQLVGILEEYLTKHRRNLIKDEVDPGTLFVNRLGGAMTTNQLEKLVSALTLRYAGKRVNPHLFRDIFAYTWLKEHPKDYLTLSKILWHSNPNTTIGIYGGRFNESNGATSIEEWLEERARKQIA